MVDPLAEIPLDVYLNNHAFWRTVPLPLWRYRLGGCQQALKKHLSSQGRYGLGRWAPWVEEVLYFAEVGHRIRGILTLQGGGMAR